MKAKGGGSRLGGIYNIGLQREKGGVDVRVRNESKGTWKKKKRKNREPLSLGRDCE